MCSADKTMSPFNYYLCHAKTDAGKSKERFVDINAIWRQKKP